MPDGGPSAFLKERAFLAADEIDETVEALCVETRGENLLAVHFTASATACEILLASADLFTAMELGAAGILMNTAVAEAQDPVTMAHAMKLAVEAGRLAYLAGRMPKKYTASASSPTLGIVNPVGR